MRRFEDNPFLRWFKLAAWIGILANLAFALPAIAVPARLLEWLHLPPVYDPVWLQDAGGLLLFVTLMYVGAARDPFRYAWTAAIMVLGRIFFACFWLWIVCYADYPRSYLLLAASDGIIALVQTILYVLMMRHEYLRPPVEPAAAR